MYELEQGSTLQGGKYRIEGILGRGGFGITYRGSTTAKISGELGEMTVKTPVAIKEFFMNTLNARDNSGVVTSPTQGSQEQVEQFRNKFIREARNLADMRHKNIINVSDVFEENGTVYYVMRYLSGGSLTDKVKQQGRLSETEAVNYIRQIGAALEYLHSRKMCHLDVKPGNVLINDDGEATLIDFGIAKVFGSDGQALTDSPVTYTTHYAPLEQYQGLQDFSPQTDLYSLGATLYFLVLGQNPPVASEVNEDGMRQKPEELSVQVWRAIVAAMQPRRKDRPESISLWMKMLDGIGTPQPANNDSEETVAPTPSPTSGEETIVSTQPQPQPQPQTLPPKFKTQPKAPLPQKKKGFNKWLLLIPVVLLVLLIGAAGAGYAIYSYLQNADNEPAEEILQPIAIGTGQAISMLDEPDLSLSKIQEVERNAAHDGSAEQEQILKQRVIALKHLYTESFLTDNHRLQSLRNIYMLHSTEYSEQQRQVMKWFFNLPQSQQEQFEFIEGKIENFQDFRQKVEEEIERSGN
mgnify:CR=1 FL=1